MMASMAEVITLGTPVATCITTPPTAKAPKKTATKITARGFSTASTATMMPVKPYPVSYTHLTLPTILLV